jgi:membrane protein
MKLSLKSPWTVTKRAFSDFWDDNALRLAASLAFYTLLSLAPLLIVAIGVAGFVFGPDAVRGELVGSLTDLVGKDGGKTIETALANASKPSDNILATIVGVALLLFGASGVFAELQAALNTIWEVKAKPNRGILGMLKDRFISFAMVLVIGFLLLVSLMVTAVLNATSDWIASRYEFWVTIGQVANQLVSFAVITVLFGLIFKVLPDVKLKWRDVLVGAMITSALFTAGKYLIGLYLGHSSVASVYGAAGSVVVLLVWSYYSTALLLFGAEVTQAYVNLRGTKVPIAAGYESTAEDDTNDEKEKKRPPKLRPQTQP